MDRIILVYNWMKKITDMLNVGIILKFAASQGSELPVKEEKAA